LLCGDVGDDGEEHLCGMIAVEGGSGDEGGALCECAEDDGGSFAFDGGDGGIVVSPLDVAIGGVGRGDDGGEDEEVTDGEDGGGSAEGDAVDGDGLGLDVEGA